MSSEEDDLSTAVAMFAQFEAQVQRTSRLTTQFASGARHLLHQSSVSSDEEPGPGRGNRVDGKQRDFFEEIRRVCIISFA